MNALMLHKRGWQLRLGFFGGVAVFLLGCQREAAAPKSPPPTTQVAAAENLAQPASAPPADDEALDAAQEAIEASLEAFSPPFSREDLFAPPQRTQTAARTSDDDDEAIELKGFVNVDGLRVVLDINGVTYPIAEGEKKYGVHVISIEPPQVVLQRGRERWTARLE